MADITVTPHADDVPPSIEIRVNVEEGQVIASASVSRIQDGGSTLIRHQPAVGNDGFIVHDYEAPYGVPIRYEATVAVGDGLTQTVAVSDEVTLKSSTGWLIHPANPAKSVQLTAGMLTMVDSLSRRTNAVRHDVLRAHYPIYTIPASRNSREFTLHLRTKALDQEDMVFALIDDQIPILFNPLPSYGFGLEPMFVQILDVQEDRFAQLSTRVPNISEWREWQWPCVEVGSPAVVQQAVGWTYADVLDENSTYDALLTSYKSYADLQAHEKRDASTTTGTTQTQSGGLYV